MTPRLYQTNKMVTYMKCLFVYIMIHLSLCFQHMSAEQKTGLTETRKLNVTFKQSKTSREHGVFKKMTYEMAFIASNMICPDEGWCISQMRCNCDSFCHVYKDCCFDNIHNPPSNSNEVWTLKERSSCFGGNYYETGRHCWVVSKCPPYWKSDVEKLKCESPNTTLLDEVVPVSSKNYQFRNKFCAVCNGIIDFEPWNIAINAETCDLFKIHDLENLPVLAAVDTLRLKHNGCELFYHPSENYPCRRCYPGIVDNCTHETFDGPDLTKYCNLYSDPFSVTGRYYNNMFCLICELFSNKEHEVDPYLDRHDNEIKSTCYKKGLRLMGGSTNEVGMGNRFPFRWSFYLRQPRALWIGSDHSKHCDKDKCKALVCPNGTLWDDNKCVSPFVGSNDVILLEKTIQCDHNGSNEIESKIGTGIIAMTELLNHSQTFSELDPESRNDSFRILRWNILTLLEEKINKKTTPRYLVQVLHTTGYDNVVDMKWPWEEICQYVSSSGIRSCRVLLFFLCSVLTFCRNLNP